MSEEPRVIDGADRRKNRLLDLLAYMVSNKGATNEEIKAFCTINFGITNKTAATYIRELHLAQLIRRKGLKWFTTGNYNKLVERLYG